MRSAYLPIVLILCCAFLTAQDGTLRGKVNVLHQFKKDSDSSGAVVWLTPYDSRRLATPATVARLFQKNKQFLPHVLVVTVGTTIEFPNRDPFFHDVFSIYHGKPFDLGLYERGTSRRIALTRPGVSYIFCNIHPEMSAVVMVLQTPYFAVTGSDGGFQIAHLPPGSYRLEVWHELASDSEVASLSRDVEISSGENAAALVTLHSSDATTKHTNKYGERYAPYKAMY